jgi:hypothetical protein
MEERREAGTMEEKREAIMKVDRIGDHHLPKVSHRIRVSAARLWRAWLPDSRGADKPFSGRGFAQVCAWVAG